MGAVTYPNPEVVQFVNQNFIPVQMLYDAQPEATDFNITWTPTMVVLDESGKEHHRNVGFQSPEEFIAFLMVGQAKTHFDRNSFEPAIALLEKVIKDFPKSGAAPEAVFHLGVSRYKATHNAAPLKEAFEYLKANYPNSEWLKRAQPYSLL
jgi:Tetratricopeptide repeat